MVHHQNQLVGILSHGLVIFVLREESIDECFDLRDGDPDIVFDEICEMIDILQLLRATF